MGRLAPLQIPIKHLKHGDMPDACVIEFLKREARDGKLGKQPLTGVIAKLTSSRDIAGELKAGAE